ncbi:putative signal peptidase complex subunit 1 [Smittium culicis]|uniref:Signal peptidase complex subunit 1 n=1 Tax=Smittium culicis TaxID=133412 RepID=A0A1R1XZA1_9FUNG|nr:putative signal peptidase complex subunit 1 [Smittium culicis]OMJ20847.1 putative signal peptidase complex subunit 1 [Smittium culicis]
MKAVLKNLMDIGKIDFKGQKLAENIQYALIVLTAIISLAAGNFMQSISIMLYSFLAGVILTILVVSPAYPAYNKNPVQWLAHKED